MEPVSREQHRHDLMNAIFTNLFTEDSLGLVSGHSHKLFRCVTGNILGGLQIFLASEIFFESQRVQINLLLADVQCSLCPTIFYHGLSRCSCARPAASSPANITSMINQSNGFKIQLVVYWSTYQAGFIANSGQRRITDHVSTGSLLLVPGSRYLDISWSSGDPWPHMLAAMFKVRRWFVQIRTRNSYNYLADWRLTGGWCW